MTARRAASDAARTALVNVTLFDWMPTAALSVAAATALAATAVAFCITTQNLFRTRTCRIFIVCSHGQSSLPHGSCAPFTEHKIRLNLFRLQPAVKAHPERCSRWRRQDFLPKVGVQPGAPLPSAERRLRLDGQWLPWHAALQRLLAHEQYLQSIKAWDVSSGCVYQP